MNRIGFIESLAQLLSKSSPSKIHTEETLKTYLLGRINDFDIPNPHSWNEEADKLRQSLLQDVIFKGVPEDWISAEPEIEWKNTIHNGNGYRIRKLTYRALPGLVIPALLYEPEYLNKSVPGVLNLNGHVGPLGKAVDYKQVRCINLVKRGMLALNPDWMYFGELQGPGYQHNNASYLDICGVAGISVFYLAMSRALDVLLAQNHVDPSRIAVTGLSGGGWQTIVLAALDTRVSVAVPNAGYIDLGSRVKHPADRGDIEQNAVDLAAIADYPTLTAMLAPRPALLLYNQYDDCCFQTARAKPSVYEPVRPLYAALGRADLFQFYNNIDPGTHNYEQEHRENLYRFLNQQFLPKEPVCDEEISSDDEILTEEQLTVGIPEANEDFVSLAKSVAAQFERKLPPKESSDLRNWQDHSKRELKSILRYRPLKVEKVDLVASSNQNEFQIRQNYYHLEDGWVLPVLESYFVAADSVETCVIVTDEGQKGATVFLEEILKQKSTAMVVEVIMQGMCELGKVPSHWSMMLSSSGARMLGLQVAQLVAVINGAGTNAVSVRACGPMSSVVALIATALSDIEVDKVVVTRGLQSLHDLIDEPGRYESMSSLFCFGLFESFDIKDIIALIQPTPVEFRSFARL